MLTGQDCLSRRELLGAAAALCSTGGAAVVAPARGVALESFGDVKNDFARTLVVALTQAARSGAFVEARAGETYVARAGVRMVDTDVRLSMNGATIIRSSTAPNEPVLTVTNRLNAVAAAVSVDETGGVSLIQLRSAAGWRKGDVGRIVSDDQLAWSDANQRRGESFVVAAVHANMLVTRQALRLKYASNVRVARHAKRACVITELRVQDDPGAPDSRNAPAVLLRGTVNAIVERPQFRNLSGEALRIDCAFAPRTTDGVFADLRTSARNNAFGYGIREVGVTDGHHSGHKGRRLRHLYTSWATTSVVDDDRQIAKYGGVVGSMIQLCWVDEPDDEGMSTHPDAFHVTFSDIGVKHATRGSIMLRGRGCLVKRCRSAGAGGLTISGNRESGGHQVSDYGHFSEARLGSAAAVIVVGAAGYQTRNVVVATLDGSTGSAPSIVMRDARLAAQLTVAIDRRGNTPVELARLSGSELDVSNLILRGTQPKSGGAIRAIMSADPQSDLRLRSVAWREGTTSREARIADRSNGAGRRIIHIS